VDHGEDMGAETMTEVAPAERLHLRVAWLCGAVLFLEGYDIACRSGKKNLTLDYTPGCSFQKGAK
jgi:hypothetical protein